MIDTHERQIRITDDGHEYIIEVVSDASSQHAEALKFLCVKELSLKRQSFLFSPFLIGNIVSDTDIHEAAACIGVGSTICQEQPPGAINALYAIRRTRVALAA